ncbi:MULTISPECIES: GNAT family N-acetyltransferase [Providencia]|uniref:GNAT family N-acetyltransferase n=1 Tax=Providencia hangzhouensis TaxID=3031799 RepID=A0ABY9Z5G5_9GAMM|nr:MULTISPECIES: GNAT family N-acetyltransferase [Providencia]MDH2377717.1 GNAT family N-acetyltransferase [Providencia rettgeri]WNK22990.1 GNAT family N-acetyltransferase [Providencia hangzhouensis]
MDKTVTMPIQFLQLNQISIADLIALNTHPAVLEHMPLGSNQFDEQACRQWVIGKEQHWEQYGYGVWAIIVYGQFAGWGGLQNEAGDADLALVLHPKFWGKGKYIVNNIINKAFTSLKVESVTIHLPLTRKKVSAILRYGFIEEAIVDFDGIPFKRFRLKHSSVL